MTELDRMEYMSKVMEILSEPKLSLFYFWTPDPFFSLFVRKPQRVSLPIHESCGWTPNEKRHKCGTACADEGESNWACDFPREAMQKVASVGTSLTAPMLLKAMRLFTAGEDEIRTLMDESQRKEDPEGSACGRVRKTLSRYDEVNRENIPAWADTMLEHRFWRYLGFSAVAFVFVAVFWEKFIVNGSTFVNKIGTVEWPETLAAGLEKLLHHSQDEKIEVLGHILPASKGLQKLAGVWIARMRPSSAASGTMDTDRDAIEVDVSQMSDAINTLDKSRTRRRSVTSDKSGPGPVIFLPRPEIHCEERNGTVRIPVFCVHTAAADLEPKEGELGELKVNFRTRDGDGIAGEQYVETHGILSFSETGERFIEVDLIDNGTWNTTFSFAVELVAMDGRNLS